MKTLQNPITLCLILVICLTEISVAQNLNISISGPSQIKVCNEETFTITIPYSSNASLWSGFSLDLNPELFNKNDLINPIADESGSLTGTDCVEAEPIVGSESFDLTIDGFSSHAGEIAGSNPNEWSFVPQANADIVFNVKVRVHCSISFESLFRQTWLGTDGTQPITVAILGGVNPFDLNVRPINFAIPTAYISQQASIVYGSPTTLEFIYGNDGTDGTIDFQMIISSACQQLPFNVSLAKYEFNSIGALMVNPTNNAIDFTSTFLGYTTVTIPPNIPGQKTFLHIFLTVDLADCIATCLTHKFDFNYRCSNFMSASPFCDHCRNLKNEAIINFSICANCLNLVVDNSNSQHKINDFSCANTSVPWEIKISAPNSNIGNIKTVEFHLTSNTGTNYLSLIHLSSITKNNTNNLSITKINNVPFTNFSDCATLLASQSICTNINGIESLDFEIHEMKPGDELTLFFETYKCAEEVSSLFNIAKYYNQWKVVANPKDICGNTITPIYLSFYGSNNCISKHGENSSSDIGLIASYNPNFTDFQQPITGTSESPPEPCFMEFDGMFGGPVDYQLVGTTGPYAGIFRIKFHSTDGIRLQDLNNDNILSNDLVVSFNNGNGGIFSPIYAYRNGTDCNSDDYFFYYDLNTIPTNQINDLILNGRMDFGLVGCCGYENANPEYTFEFSILLTDPNDLNCHSFTIPVTGSGAPTCYSGNSPCPWLPLSSITKKTHLHCPGCYSPGIIVDRYYLERTTFGLEDHLDQGVDDNGTVINRYNYPYPIDANHSMYNDLLEDRMSAHFEDGNYIDGGYTYSMMQNNYYTIPPSTTHIPDPITLKVLQLDRRIPYSNSNAMDLIVSNIDLYIDVDPSIATGQSIDIANWNLGYGTSSWTTVAHFSISGTQIATFLLQSADPNHLDQLFFTFDPVDLNDPNVISSYDATYDFFNTGFLPGQRYRLKVNYSVCGNYIDLDIPFREAIIENVMWLSGIKQDYDIRDNNPEPQQPMKLSDLCGENLQFESDPCGMPNVTQQNFAEQFIFYCEACGNMHYFIASNMKHIVYITATDPCFRNLEIQSAAYCADEGLSQDLFKYEFRPPNLTPQYWKLTLPTGMTYKPSTASFQNLFKVGLNTNNLNFVPSSILNVVDFTENDLLSNPIKTFNCRSLTPILTSPIVDDNRLSYKIFLKVDPGICLNSSVTVPKSNFFADFANTSSSICNSSPGQCSSVFTLDTESQNNPSFDAFNPQILFSTTQPQSGTFSMQATITVTNSNAVAHNAFIALPQQILCDIYSISLTPNQGSPPVTPTNNMFQLGDIPNGATYTYSLSIILYPCSCQPTSNILSLTCGWNCNGYPTYPVIPASVCFSQPLDIVKINPIISFEVQSNGSTVPSSISRCQPFNYSATFKNTGQGAIRPTYVELSQIANGLDVLSVKISNPFNSQFPSVTLSPWPTLPNRFAIDNADLAALGYNYDQPMNTNYLEALDEIYVEVELVAGCEFIYPQNCPFITVSYSNFCGTINYVTETFNANPQIPNFDQDNPSECTDCITIDKIAIPSAALPGMPVQFDITVCPGTNNDPSITNFDVDLTDILPPPADFVVTSNPLPVTFNLLVPGPCATYSVTGYFNTEGYCPTNSHNNIAVAQVVGGTYVAEDNACVDVNCANVQLSMPAFSTVTNISSLGSSISGLTLRFDADIIIDVDFVIDHCAIIMGPGTQILLPANGYVDLTIHSSTIIGCNEMWQGIKVENENSLIMDSHTILRDANEGIHASGNATFEVYDSEITECVTGITTPANSSGTFQPTSGIVTGTTFGLINAPKLKKLYPGQVTGCTGNSTRPKAGIFINNVAYMNIGDKTQNPNHFVNLTNGIIGFASNLNVNNSYFKDIFPVVNNHYFAYDGSALSSNGDKSKLIPANLTVTGPPVINTTNIDNALTGVFTEYSYLYASDLQMDNVQTGVYSTNSGTVSVKARSNVINASRVGIDWIGNNTASSMVATNNQITIENGRGISLQENASSASANYYIAGNEITLNDALHGIYINCVRSPIVIDNTITQNFIQNMNVNNGISLLSSPFAQISCNIITSNYPNTTSETGSYGIYTSLSETYSIKCNNTTGHNTGFYFGGLCKNSTDSFQGNTMQDQFVGLYLNSVANVSPQNHRGNKWFGSFHSNYDAVNMNWPPNANLVLSLLTVDPSPQSGFTFTPSVPIFVTPPFNVDDQQWINPQMGSQTYSCLPIVGCLTNPNPGGGGGAGAAPGDGLINSFIARDSVLTTDFVDESKSIAKQFLYEDAKTDTSILNNDTIVQNFVASNASESIGLLYESKAALIEANTIKDSILVLLKISDSLQIGIIDSLELLDSLVLANPTINYVNQRLSLVNDLNSQQQVRSNLIQQQQGNNLIQMAQAEFFNDLVIPNELPEANEKFINDMVIKLNNSGVVGLVNDLPQILDIATMCPYQGGPSVYNARVLASYFDNTMQYDDVGVCFQHGVLKQQMITNGLKGEQVQIIPNPANTEAEVIVSGKLEGICKIEIRDAVGKTILEQTFSCNKRKHALNLSSLAPGAYVVIVNINGSLNQFGKLVIAR